MNIGNRVSDRNNHFDFIRLLAAIGVVFSHSFPLSYGYINGQDPDPLHRITGSVSIGGLSVMVFFVISGFLITMSFQRSKSLVTYLRARILRIFPALWIVVIISAIVAGPILTILPVTQYFGDAGPYKYIIDNGVLYNFDFLPGVFAHNPMGGINGSLWTLRYEFICYLIVAALGILSLVRKEVVLVLFIATTALAHFHHGGWYTSFFEYFSAGMLFYTFRSWIPLRWWIAVLSVLILFLSWHLYNGFTQPILVLSGAYIIFYVALQTNVNLSRYMRFGDLSYGAYIYAFPVQQTVTYLFHGHIAWWENFSVSLPIILLLAYASWHLIEKRALKLKNVKFNSARKQVTTTGA